MKDLKKQMEDAKFWNKKTQAALDSYNEKLPKVQKTTKYISSLDGDNFNFTANAHNYIGIYDKVSNAIYGKRGSKARADMDAFDTIEKLQPTAETLQTLTSLNTKYMQKHHIVFLYEKIDSLGLPESLNEFLVESYERVTNNQSIKGDEFQALINDIRARDQLKHIIANPHLLSDAEKGNLEKYKDIIKSEDAIDPKFAEHINVIHSKFEHFSNMDMEKKVLDGTTAELRASLDGITNTLDKALDEMIPQMYEDISSQLHGQDEIPRQEMIADVVRKYMKETGVHAENKTEYDDKERKEIKEIAKEIDKAMQSRKDVKEHPIQGFVDTIRHFIAEFIKGADYLLQNSKTTEELLGKTVKEGKFAAKIRAEQDSARQIER